MADHSTPKIIFQVDPIQEHITLVSIFQFVLEIHFILIGETVVQ